MGTITTIISWNPKVKKESLAAAEKILDGSNR